MTSTPETGAEPAPDETADAELVAQSDESVVADVAAEEATIADAAGDDDAAESTEIETAEAVETEVVPSEPDAELLAAHELALSALHEITRPQTVGPAAGYTLEVDGVVSLRFENRLPGYPGWYWTVSLARVEGAEPTVLEVELLPGDGALLAPEWVPWATRLAEYHAQQAAAAEAAAEAEGDGEDADEGSDDETEDLDESDDEDDEAEDGEESILHAGDVDGVDIDELDDDYDESDDDESDDDDDSEDDDESDDDDEDDSDRD